MQDVTRFSISQLAPQIIGAASHAIMVTDRHSVIQWVNSSFSRVTGYSAAEALGQTPRLLSSGVHSASFYKAIWQPLQQHGQWQGEIWNKRKNGEIYPQQLSITAIYNPQQQVCAYAALFSDISQRKQQEARINQLAYFDELTGLANRRLFQDRLQLALANAHRHQHTAAVMFLDLDLFKGINDSLGHLAGDQALQQVAARIVATVREGESVARLGGDEFTILIPEISGNDAVEQLAKRLITLFEQPMNLLGQQFMLTTSIGIALYPQHADNAELLLKNADQAMYQAKNAGRNQFCFYQSGNCC